MGDVEVPEQVASAQQAADAAWAALEEYRKQVDAARAEDTPDEPGRPAWIARPRRPWTDDENAKYAELHAAAIAASERRRDVMQAAGIVSTYESERAARAAARAG